MNCYLYVFNGYSDWEPALAIYGLNTFTDIKVITFSANGGPIRSGGNVHVQPDAALADVQLAADDLLMLPGGMEQGDHTALLPLLRAHMQQKAPVAAICGATVFMGIHGLLNNIQHTSNDLGMLKMMAPGYTGEALYVQAPAATDSAAGVITASGTAMVEFTRAIYERFNLLQNKQLAFWFGFFLKSGAPEMQTVPPFHFLYRSYRTSLQQLQSLVRTPAREIFAAAAVNGLEPCGPLQWHYYGADGNPDTEFTLEIGVPVMAAASVPAPFACKTTEAFKCVSVTHKGDWQTMGQTYQQIMEGFAMAGMQPSGHSRELYIRYDFNNPAVNETVIQTGI